MTKEEIEEGNKLIAEFMGGITTNPEIWRSQDLKLVSRYEYHSSWDWLMPVVEKINILREVNEVSISPGRTRIWLQESFIQSPHKPENTSIIECWICIVQFIKWHNTQTTHK